MISLVKTDACEIVDATYLLSCSWCAPNVELFIRLWSCRRSARWQMQWALAAAHSS